MADDRTIRVRFQAEVQNYLAGVKAAGAATQEFGKGISGQGAATKKQMESVGKGALLMAGGITVALGLSAKAAIDWESSWAGVNKTVDGTAAQMGELEDGLRGLARELPATHKEIAAVAEAAGQLGVQRDAILGFTRVMVDLGETTNLTADEAATSIAQIMNIFQTGAGDVDNFASTLVALGNAGASTEREILDMAQRLAGAGKLIGATEGEILALANGMASMGIQAQLGGGAFSRVMRNIYTAVEDGGDAVEGFARVAGMSAQEFSRAFEEDPIRAIDSFIQGLNGVEASGGNVVKVLSDLGFKGTQDLAVLLSLKGAGDLLTDSLDLQAKAWKDNTALAIEANKRYETTASQLSVLKNNVVDLGIDLGGVLLPALKGAAGGVTDLLAGFQAMPDAMKTGVVGIGGVSAAGLGLIGLLGTLAPKFMEFQSSLIAMGGFGEKVGNNLGKITLAAGGVLGAIGLVTYAIGVNAQRAAEAEADLDAWVEALKEAGDAAAGAESKIGQLVTENSDLAAFLADTEMTIHDVATALSGTDADWLTFADRIRSAGEAAGMSGDEITQIGLLLGGQREQLGDAIPMWEDLAEVEDEAAVAAGELTAAQEQQQQTTEDLTDAVKELIDAERAAIDPLFGMLDATAANAEANVALADAQANGETSAEELAAAHQAAAKSALDMEAASLTLAGAIEAGTVNVEIAKSTLAGWVAQGLITQETADRMGVKFDEAATKANALAGERVVTLTAVDNASGTIDTIQGRLARLGRGVTVPIGSKPSGHYPQLYRDGPLQAAGGPAGFGPMSSGPSGTDTIPAWLTPGEFVMRKDAVDKYGLPFLYDLNAMKLASGGMVRQGEVSEAEWNRRIAAGWKDDPNDEMEALYHPVTNWYYGNDPGWSGTPPSSGGINHNLGSAATSPIPTAAPKVAMPGDHRVILDVRGGGDDLARVIQKWVRTNGGNVQVLAGR